MWWSPPQSRIRYPERRSIKKIADLEQGLTAGMNHSVRISLVHMRRKQTVTDLVGIHIQKHLRLLFSLHVKKLVSYKQNSKMVSHSDADTL